jgi:hypothetical protein
MAKPRTNYWIDVGLAISFLIVFITGVIKWPGLLFKLGVNVKNLPIKRISLAHDWAGLIMGILVFVHLILHWKWIVVMTKSLFKKKEKEVPEK